MLNHSEFRRSFRPRGVMPQKTGPKPHAETQETYTALRLGTTEAAALELIIELDRIGRIVREIERELSQWDASESRGDSRAP
jgi:hypothetical protein